MAELQKHQLLVKLLKMTGSSNDGEALIAIRKANELLAAAGWDWDKLMAGKITVVGDPFANLGDPTPTAKVDERNYYPPPKAAPTPTKPRRLPINSTRSNQYEGACYCCGILVAVNGGFIFRPSDYHSRATTSWRIACTTCNASSGATVGPSPAPRRGQGARKVTADDLA